MKANKAVKRLAKIEALLVDMTKRYAAGAPLLRGALENVGAAVARAKEAASAKPAKAAKAKRKLKAGGKSSKKASVKASKAKPRKKRAARKVAAKSTGPAPPQVPMEAATAPIGSGGA